ncbi:MAG: Fic family protein [Oligoflexia bacterium]|nr:Fic family protein [Oligoflexia bacterium]
MTAQSQSPKKLNHRLAEALDYARAVSRNGIVRTSDLKRGVRERLVNASFLTEVMRGWYLLTSPAGAGSTTLWYSNYWEFVKQYLSDRFGDDGYCLSAESSLDVYSAQHVISRQLVILTRKSSNQTLQLLHDTSLMLYSDESNFPTAVFRRNGLNLFPLPEAICRAAPAYFQNSSLNAEICLRLVPSAAELSRVLLSLGSPAAAGRVTGAYRRLGDGNRAEQIQQDLAAAGQPVTPHDPFINRSLHLVNIQRLSSPHAGRIRALWDHMRPTVEELFPRPPGALDTRRSMRIIDKFYSEDAYHSLSIEGYQITEDLIRRIHEGHWDPESEKSDYEQRNALAAKGYLGAFRAVTASIGKTMKGENAGKAFSNDLQIWYRELFVPSVQAGLMTPAHLAGYRNHPVYIAQSRHVPPPGEGVLDAMETLERLLVDESHAGVRAVLGHFIFVFIHPYMDGNGRIGRFLMNLMLVSGGYNWTVIRASERARYMASLEAASTRGEIQDFTKFVVSEMEFWKARSREA